MWHPPDMMQVDRRDKYQQMHTLLNEKQWRQYLALEAKERGSVAQVAQEAKVSQNTIRRGIREVEAGEVYTPEQRQREKGGGRKKVSEKDPTLLSDLEGLASAQRGSDEFAQMDQQECGASERSLTRDGTYHR
jgi:predicted transcriptional regulator